MQASTCHTLIDRAASFAENRTYCHGVVVQDCVTIDGCVREQRVDLDEVCVKLFEEIKPILVGNEVRFVGEIISGINDGFATHTDKFHNNLTHSLGYVVSLRSKVYDYTIHAYQGQATCSYQNGRIVFVKRGQSRPTRKLSCHPTHTRNGSDNVDWRHTY